MAEDWKSELLSRGFIYMLEKPRDLKQAKLCRSELNKFWSELEQGRRQLLLGSRPEPTRRVRPGHNWWRLPNSAVFRDL